MPVHSTSIHKVFDVLIAAFPATPTDNAVNDLQESVLAEVEAMQPRGVVLDISRVTTLDSFFARVISETASMINLIGGEVIVVGMRPEVAITAAQLGYSFDGITTARNTDHALEVLGVTGEHATDNE